ncbi:YDG/SRA domain-containing protein [Streptomyces sp. NPDC048172]|uniref:YDG/SRA domain-containing protein n=1 Tax=Streptomyces sp. NPDC048172 TaxID=3365505 RepID=UPI003722BA33
MAKAPKKIKFGTPDGVQEGDVFDSHAALYAAGLHRFLSRGISGTAATGADSIVFSGGYPDDKDLGDVILYTGQGKGEDQSFSVGGNAALVVSKAKGKPVRAIEGLDIKQGRATGGYKYRGLYRVAGFWMAVGHEGFQICQFELRKLSPGEAPQPEPVAPVEDGDTNYEAQARRLVQRLARARDSKVVREVKKIYGDTCQICHLRLEVSSEGNAYSEGAHIHALGKPHDGPDVIENVLCLCPNCHILFDRGVLMINDDLEVFDMLQGTHVSTLTHEEQKHGILVEYLHQHRSRWPDRVVP